ncbi:FtsX-like permease family protein [Nonomuraea sp. NPDC051941]|uniref:FtsX-like permease family protein n=1 Tax=Nonomuraea sp. NPDC051941 TaxID=3364373 RepID=UPI0037C80F2D
MRNLSSSALSPSSIIRFLACCATHGPVGAVREIGSPAAAYTTKTAFEQHAGPARDLRIATSDTAAVQRVLRDARVEGGPLATTELREAIDGHIFVLISAVTAMAVLMAIVGVLGLTAATGTSVVERTREFAVMQAIGVDPDRCRRLGPDPATPRRMKCRRQR